ncbi:hypothetical protein [Mycobacterium malmoense]|uniref:hypothetical protein n=1 Tax=Mycobacterium malmoense TaxID=1780 RepID=UPI0008F86D86|nr:hypothetical protein [Mycobacterium malmoense]OIN82450.1 hypothetical protein BMG05_02235 [Mycobacterium malmoense]
MSADPSTRTPSSGAGVVVRPQPALTGNDCSVAVVRDEITAQFDGLPFLGELRCSHHRVVAGSLEEVVFTYTVGGSGIADSGWLKLCFRYYSDWDLQTTTPDGRDFATARVVSRSLIGGASEGGAATVQQLVTSYDVKGGERPFQKSLLIHVVDGYLRPGDVIEIRCGDRRFGGPGTRMQTFVEDEFEVHLFVDPLGTSRMAHAGVHRIAVVPGAPERVVVQGPRLVRSDASAVHLHAHLEDRWGNTCSDTSATLHAIIDGVTVASAGTPATGWSRASLCVPAASARVGVVAQTSTAVVASGETVVDVVDDFPAPRAYFCDLHVHSNDTVGTQDTDWNLRYARDVAVLDAVGYTANDFQITDDAWDDVVKACRKISKDGAFVCFPGVEWCGTPGAGGDHNVVFLGEDTTLARSLEWHQRMATTALTPQTWPVTQLYAAYEKDPESYLLIPHVGGRRAILDWHHPELERLIEVHSTWGSSPWFLEDALARGLRLGASAASDEHRGRPGAGAPGANIFGGFGGLTGVIAPALSAGDIGRSLRARRTWATTGARAVALLRSGDNWMGDEFTTDTNELGIEYALYGTTGWDDVAVYDSAGLIWHRDLHAEAGLSRDLVRIRWGGARHRDRYRWATWSGGLRIDGTAVEDVIPWAITHPEQIIDSDGPTVAWDTKTYGSDIGFVVRLADLSRARFEFDTTVREEKLSASAILSGADLMAEGHRDMTVGALNLRVRLERIADPKALPTTATGGLNLHLPEGNGAIYLRGNQFDGHQVWTSPLFVTRTAGRPQ